MAPLENRARFLAGVAGLALLAGCGELPATTRPVPPPYAAAPPVNFYAWPQPYDPPAAGPPAMIPPVEEAPVVPRRGRNSDGPAVADNPPVLAPPAPSAPPSEPSAPAPDDCRGYWRICHFF